jgi:hypothetical protein
MSHILEMSIEELEEVVTVVYEFLTVDCRTKDITQILHGLYDTWTSSFLCYSGSEMMSHQTVFPNSPGEVIARSLVCIDTYKNIYTKLFELYESRRIHTQADKMQVLRKCNEVIARMHLVCRGFACLAQVTTVGFEPNMSVERVAHDYGMMLPFLNGLDLPIDYNVPGRQSRGTYDSKTDARHYLRRYVEAVVEQQKLRIHGSMLYTQHVLPDPASPGGFIHTRFWKPYKDLGEFIYRGI